MLLNRKVLRKPRNQKLNPEIMFKRLSQITGVPMREFYPAKYRDLGEMNPHYNPNHHSIDMNGFGKLEFIRAHEWRHALQGVVVPHSSTLKREILEDQNKIKFRNKSKEELSEFFKYVKFLEATNSLGALPSIHAINSMVETRVQRIKKNILALSVSFAITGLIPAYAPFLFFPALNYARSIQFKRMALRHGEDSILLLWTHPPTNEKGQIILNFGKWEKKMVEDGFLKPAGGFTPKGLRFFRERVNHGEIRRRMAEFKKVRKQIEYEETLEMLRRTKK